MNSAAWFQVQPMFRRFGISGSLAQNGRAISTNEKPPTRPHVLLHDAHLAPKVDDLLWQEDDEMLNWYCTALFFTCDIQSHLSLSCFVHYLQLTADGSYRAFAF